jgi:hypothetical protein
MGARLYEPRIGRWVSADTIVPGPANPQALNRYVYVLGNPLRFRDPTGHYVCLDVDCNWGQNPVTGEIVWRAPLPPVVVYIWREMTANAQGETVELLQSLNAACHTCRLHDPSTAGSHAWEAAVGAAGADALAKARALLIFGWTVRQNGPWDPKQDIANAYGFTQRVGDLSYYYDVWGNMMFGYLGAASGFSKGELLGGAGLEQIGSSLGYAVEAWWKEEDPSSKWPRRQPGLTGLEAWDLPMDRRTARVGIWLWNTYDLSLSPMDIMSALATRVGDDPRPFSEGG